MSLSDDDYSELTDLEDDDEYQAKGKKKAVPKGGVTVGYKIRNALKVPRATTYTAQALYDQMHSQDINLDAEYQRDVVWPDTKQIGLIDSVFRNFYIPPVIFAVSSYEDGSETKICIDGKQRLTSIQRFMDGIIPHKDPITAEKYWYKDIGSSSKASRAKKILPEKYRRLFSNKQIVCVEYQDITDSDEREIFQRVQLGMALTPAEKLQVLNTPRAAFIRELLTTFLNDEGGLAGDALDWDRSRGGDFRCLAQVVFCIDKYSAALKNIGSIQQLEKWLSADDELPLAFKTRVQDTFRVFQELVLDSKLNKVFKNPAKISPIEFILISILIAMSKDKMSKAQLSAAVGQMRDDVRAAHLDIRMNTRVAKTMLDFIKTCKPSKVAGDPGGIAGSTGEKRKRGDADDGVPKPKTKKPTPATPVAAPSAPPLKADPPKAMPSTSARPTPTPKYPTAAPTDRLAVLRAAKNAGQNSSHPPSSSASPHPISIPTSVQQALQNFNASTTHMLPSPSLSNSHPSPSIPQGPRAPQYSNALESSLMNPMLHRGDPRTRPDHAPAQSSQQPLNGSAHPSRFDSNGTSRKHSQDYGYPSTRDTDWDRDRERDRDHRPPSASAGSSYGSFSNRPSDSGWGNRGVR